MSDELLTQEVIADPSEFDFAVKLWVAEYFAADGVLASVGDHNLARGDVNHSRWETLLEL